MVMLGFPPPFLFRRGPVFGGECLAKFDLDGSAFQAPKHCRHPKAHRIKTKLAFRRFAVGRTAVKSPKGGYRGGIRVPPERFCEV